MNHKVENCLSAGLQFLLLEIKKLPVCAGDLFYSSWSPVGWSGQGCHVKWLNDSKTECSCNHLTHFAVLMQFDTDSELKTGQNSRLQKVGYKTERAKVCRVWKEGSWTCIHSLFRISFFSKLASVAKLQLFSILGWHSRVVSRQRIPASRTVFCSQRILFPGNALLDTEERLAIPSGSTSTTFQLPASRQIPNPINVFRNPALYFVKIADPVFRLSSR